MSNLRSELNDYDRRFLDKQIDIIEDSCQEVINYPYDITVSANLSMLINRIRRGVIQKIDINKSDYDLLDTNKELKSLSTTIINNISNYLNCQLDDSEIYYLFEILYVTNIGKRLNRKDDEILADAITTEMITKYFSISDVSLLYQSRQLYKDLYNHILPMLGRLRLGIRVENNLLTEVKLNYGHVFNKLLSVISQINSMLPFEKKIDESEVGYLTLYFEKYNLEIKKERRVLLVCSTGVGTSELLKARLKTVIPSIDIIATMSVRQVKRNIDFVSENIDFILSTVSVDLGEEVEIPTIFISPILTKVDIQKIHYLMEEENKSWEGLN